MAPKAWRGLTLLAEALRKGSKRDDVSRHAVLKNGNIPVREGGPELGGENLGVRLITCASTVVARGQGVAKAENAERLLRARHDRDAGSAVGPDVRSDQFTDRCMPIDRVGAMKWRCGQAFPGAADDGDLGRKVEMERRDVVGGDMR